MIGILTPVPPPGHRSQISSPSTKRSSSAVVVEISDNTPFLEGGEIALVWSATLPLLFAGASALRQTPNMKKLGHACAVARPQSEPQGAGELLRLFRAITVRKDFATTMDHCTCDSGTRYTAPRCQSLTLSACQDVVRRSRPGRKSWSATGRKG